VDPEKYIQNIRLLSVNPRGFRPDISEKITILKRSKERLMFDRVFFSSPDQLWNTRRKDLMRKKILSIGRNIQINTSDTKLDVTIKHGYLPGGTMSIVWD